MCERKIKKPALTLVVLLVLSSVFVTCVGLVMKSKIQNATGGYEKKIAIAVPFLLLHDDTELRLMQQRGGDTQPSGTVGPTGTTGATEQPNSQPSSDQTTAPSTSEPPTTPPTTLPETVPTVPLAVYGQDESYFDDALFIGDSRTVGLSQYARLGKADYFADVGLSVFQMFSVKATDEGFSKATLEELLGQKQYGKIYIMLGLNEAGYPLSSLADTYRSDLEQIKALQPNAKIYLQALFGVTRNKASATSYLVPENVAAVNAEIQALADGADVFYLDFQRIFTDEEGFLLEDYTGDGVHLYGKYYAMWSQWLCEHAQ